MTEGGSESSATFSASRRVPFCRLSRMRRFFSSVQRPSAMLSPARWTTASVPEMSPSMTPASGFHLMSPSKRSVRVRRLIVCPLASRAGVKADPIRPVAPLMRTSMLLLQLRTNTSYGNARYPIQPYDLSHAPLLQEIYLTKRGPALNHPYGCYLDVRHKPIAGALA